MLHHLFKRLYRSQLTAVVTTQVFVHSAMVGMRFLLPLWALSQGYSVFHAGVLVALTSVGSLFLAITIGRYADRVGIYKPVRIGCMLSFTACVVLAIVPTLATAMLGSILIGLGAHIGIISGQRFVGKRYPEPHARRSAFAWFATGPSLANTLAPIVAGICADLFGYRFAFSVMALLPVLTWLLINRVQVNTQDIAIPLPISDTQKKTTWGLLDNVMLRRVLAINLINSIAWDMHTILIPILGQAKGFSATSIGTVLSVYGIATLTVRMLLPFVNKYISEITAMMGSLLLTGMGYAIYPWTNDWQLWCLISACLGVSIGSMQPMIMSLLTHESPPYRQGEILGLRFMIVNASAILTPLLLGSFGAAIGVGSIFSLFAITSIGGIKIAIDYRKHYKPHTTPSA